MAGETLNGMKYTGDIFRVFIMFDSLLHSTLLDEVMIIYGKKSERIRAEVYDEVQSLRKRGIVCIDSVQNNIGLSLKLTPRGESMALQYLDDVDGVVP